MAGKKRKASGRQPASKGPKEFNEKDGKLGPIRTFEDVADSEDEFHINRDKVMLDEGPNAKRQRKYEEDGMLYHAVSQEVAGLLLTAIRCFLTTLRRGSFSIFRI